MTRLLQKYKNIPIQAKASFWFLVCSVLQRGISVITTPIFTRLLTTDEYGEFNLINSWMSIIGVFVSLHLFSGIYTQGLVKFSDLKDKYSSALQGLVLVLVLVWTSIYLLFHTRFNNLLNLSTAQVLAILLMIWTSAVFNFWAATKRVEYKYISLIILTLLVALLKPLIGIYLVIHYEDKVTARLLGIAGVEFVCYIGLFLSQMKKGKVFFSKEIWKYGLSLGIPLIPHYLSQTVLDSSDRIMIEKMVDVSSVGIYSLAYSLSMIMTLINGALLQTLDPWIYQKIKDKRINDIGKIAYASLGLIGILNLLLITIGPELIRFFAPAEYYEAVWVIPPIAMSVFFLFAYNLFADFEFYFEKTKALAFATMIGAVLNIVLNYFFINIFGYIAAGYTTLICYVFYAGLHYAFMHKICEANLHGEQPYDLRVILIISLAFIVSGFAVMFTYSYPFIRYTGISMAIVFLLLNCRKIEKLFITVRMGK